jgi:hypothetical protein
MASLTRIPVPIIRMRQWNPATTVLQSTMVVKKIIPQETGPLNPTMLWVPSFSSFFSPCLPEEFIISFLEKIFKYLMRSNEMFETYLINKLNSKNIMSRVDFIIFIKNMIQNSY